ncbi:MAG: type II toxin-antitoxin system VapB family antitoxin [Candidatus Parabeggiatoa sp. nov. 3]|nr:MAG: type II toxin-antitoxin system VapB family antitoxin [Gammaproteobacteria bacterium]RKZ60365.1 MAG: type II toxin-antitoxin system VapB family antitoxin [Gammaproteobacteria bacterium]RKZ79036.1 MAG: type II toxin-antitoxin system VapB family antitoxin [Gammaproteobacteria bacterium]
MKISLTIDDNLFLSASQLTGILDKKALLNAGLKALITLESRQWLIS